MHEIREVHQSGLEDDGWHCVRTRGGIASSPIRPSRGRYCAREAVPRGRTGTITVFAASRPERRRIHEIAVVIEKAGAITTPTYPSDPGVFSWGTRGGKLRDDPRGPSVHIEGMRWTAKRYRCPQAGREDRNQDPVLLRLVSNQWDIIGVAPTGQGHIWRPQSMTCRSCRRKPCRNPLASVVGRAGPAYARQPQ